MTIAEKLRRCTDSQLAALILELKGKIVKVEQAAKEPMTPVVMERILQKPFIPEEVLVQLGAYEDAKP